MTSRKCQFAGEVVKLGAIISSLESGKRERGGAALEGVPSIGGEHINSNGSIDWNSKKMRYVSPEFYSRMKKGRIKKSDVLVVKDGATTGKTAFVDTLAIDAAVNEHVFILRFDTEVKARYVAYYLMSSFGQEKIKEHYKGSAIGGIGRSIADIQLVLYNEDELKTIVDRFNILRALTLKCDEMLIKLESLVKSRFVEMFGDPCNAGGCIQRVRIDSLCELRIGPFGSSLHKEDYIAGGHALVNPSHIIGGSICVDCNLTISNEKFNAMSAYHLHQGDVVLGRRGEIGRCAVVREEGLICGTGSMILRPLDNCRSEYLQSVVSFPSFCEALESNAVGVTMKNLNAKIVGSAEIYLPPIEEQDAFIAFVARADKLRLAA